MYQILVPRERSHKKIRLEKLCELVQVGLTQGGANEPKAQDWMLAWTVYLVILSLCSISVEIFLSLLPTAGGGVFHLFM